MIIGILSRWYDASTLPINSIIVYILTVYFRSVVSCELGIECERNREIHTRLDAYTRTRTRTLTLAHSHSHSHTRALSRAHNRPAPVHRIDSLFGDLQL